MPKKEKKEKKADIAAEVDGDDEDYEDEVENEEEEVEVSAEVDTTVPDDDDAIEKAASWMSGKWGISWRHNAGDHHLNADFDARKLVSQVSKIPGCSYVLFGLSSGAKGNQYIAPHSVLSEINPGTCPKRDLFDDLATQFQEAGYKVLVYMATEGPAQLHHGPDNDTSTEWVENWKSHVNDIYGSDDIDTLKMAYAKLIVAEYAKRYGTKIDGWWFDHASYGDIPLLRKTCKEWNPDAILAFNIGGVGKVACNRPGYEDYTKGHPTPLRTCVASHPDNEQMVKSIEKSSHGYLYGDGQPSLGHMFMPMKQKWNSGASVVWPEDRALDWMGRVLDAGGAWTWNVPLDNKKSKLDKASVDFATLIGEQLIARKDGGDGDEL